MKGVYWPARLTQEIEVKKLLSQSSKGKSFEITSLPTYVINETNSIHKTIETLIQEIKTNESFTFEFLDEYTLEQVKSYSIIAYGALSIMVIVNTILIILLYLKKLMKLIKHKSGNEDNEDIESGLRQKLSRKLHFSPRDSLKLSPRGSLRRLSRRLSKVRDDLSTSGWSSGRSSLRDTIKRRKRKFKKSVLDMSPTRHRKQSLEIPLKKLNRHIEEDSPRLVDVSTNTQKTYTNLSPQVVPRRVASTKRRPPLKAYN